GADADELSAEAGLDEKLGFDHVSRQVLRYALEDEFGIVATADEVLGLTTVAAVVAFVESRTAPDAEASGPDVGEDEPAPAAG
ncbi:MAG: acyl carrier protein, partial [Armatimonadetes bacterium]|nr:acyl carrier protein [Armatimonadota bacterium]